MVAQRTLLILTCIVGAYLLAAGGVVGYRRLAGRKS